MENGIRELEAIKVINIIMDDGKEQECNVLSNIVYEKKIYVAVQPIDSDNFFAMEVKFNKDDSFEVIQIEDDDVYERIMDSFEEEFDMEDDYYDYGDGDDEVDDIGDEESE